MKIFRSEEFESASAWRSELIANMNGITTKIHWTDKPCKWHMNDGQEVFVVLDGVVKMLYMQSGVERSSILKVGDIFYASVGTEHIAYPEGEVRVIESEGSI